MRDGAPARAASRRWARRTDERDETWCGVRALCGRAPLPRTRPSIDDIHQRGDPRGDPALGRQYGEPPTTVDWDPSRARRLDQAWRAARFEEGLWPTAALARGRFKQFNAVVERAGLAPHWRIARYRDGDWPSARSVAHHFGSFTNAVVQAGLVHRDRGVHHVDRRSQRAANRVRVAHAIAEARRPGVDDLAERLRGLAAARRAEDPVSKRAALLDRAASALAGAQICGTEA